MLKRKFRATRPRRRLISKKAIKSYFGDSRKISLVYLLYNLGLEENDSILVFETKQNAINYLKKKKAEKDGMFGWLINIDGWNHPYKLERKRVIRG